MLDPAGAIEDLSVFWPFQTFTIAYHALQHNFIKTVGLHCGWHIFLVNEIPRVKSLLFS